MPGPRTNPLWKRCEHGTLLFFAWHRGYLYFFERILRKATGDNSFNLPYWDWSTSPSVPLPYREPADPSNPLFHERDINDGSLIPQQFVVDDLNTAMIQTDFGSFSPLFEGSPHGQVHVTVGGDMSQVPLSARDPIFWLHHGNIDRNWDRWLNLNDGRLNPGDSSWGDVQYSYADENGQTVTVRVADIVSSAALGYRYDDTPNPVLPAMAPRAAAQRAAVVAAAAPDHGGGGHGPMPAQGPGTVVAASAEAGGPTAVAALPAKPLGFAPATVPLQAAPAPAAAPMHEAVRAAHPNRPGHILIDIQGLSVAATPKFTYDVYLNLPDGEVSPERLRAHRVGSINFFGKGPQADHEHASATFDETLDATATIARLRELGAWDPQKIAVTLRPVTAVAPAGKEAAARDRAAASADDAKITYRRISLRVVP
jgi:tyrosinase